MTSSSSAQGIQTVVAPPNLLLAVRRLAAAAGSDAIVSAGSVPYRFDGEPAVVTARALDGDELPGGCVAITRDPVAWDDLRQPRLVVAVDEGRDGEPFASLGSAAEAASAAGWRIAHTGLLHTGAGTPASPRRESAVAIACRDDDPIAESLATGALSLSLDPLIADVTDAAAPARVLIASYEITGPTGNGGIGTAYHSLAHSLAASGNDVTALFTGWMDRETARRLPEWQERFARGGVDFALLGTPWAIPVRSPHHGVRRAYEFHRWLLEAHARQPFDVVHLPETVGHGAFALTAKALGIAYHDIEFVIGTHSSTRWVAECNREPIENVDLLAMERLERIAVARADVVLSPSAYLVDYMRERGWQLPERTFVLPYARPQSVRELSREEGTEGAHTTPRELVFFGRLETRKGLEAFCDAVDLLLAGDNPFERVAFVGRPERVLGEDSTAYIERRASGWGDLPWKILPDLGHDDAIDYLRATPCVVAIPSLVDNSPNTVYEAIALGIPFVASRAGGTGEIIDGSDLAASTFDGWHDAVALEPPTFSHREERFDASALAEALRMKAAAPFATTVAPAVSDVACDRVYDRWHRAIAVRSRAARRAEAPAAGRLPTAAVCIVGADVADVRRIAASLLRAERPPVAIAALLDPALDCDVIAGVELVRASGRATGPARRALAERLDADLLIVLRGSQEPDADLVERVSLAMAAGRSDVLSFVSRDPDNDRDTGIPGMPPPEQVDDDLRAFVPLAGPALAAAVYPALSVGAYAISRAALERVGGYAPDTWDELVDDELLARAALAGERFDVHPDPLATTVRDDRWTTFRTFFIGSTPAPVDEGEALIRRLRPFRGRLDDALADLPTLLAGAQREVNQEIARRRELIEAYETRITEFIALGELYERRLAEHRELIELYERQKAELSSALELRASTAAVPAPASGGRVRRRLRRAARPPISAWPSRGVRFARTLSTRARSARSRRS